MLDTICAIRYLWRVVSNTLRKEVRRTPLAQILWDLGIERQELARSMNVSPTSITRWCNGERPIPPARVLELAQKLNVEPSQIKGEVPA